MNLVELDENRQLIIADELHGIKSFKDLIEDRYSKGKDEEYVTNELLYIYFMHDLRSDYMIYEESERSFQVLDELDLDEDYKPDQLMIKAMEKYKDLTETKISSMLKATYTLIDKVIKNIEEIDLNDVDKNGRPIYTLKDTVDAGNKCSVLAEKVAKLEELQAANLKDKSKIRGGRVKSIFEDL